MDADKRHQLKTNELAEALTKLRDFGGDRQTRIWLAVLAVALIVIVGYRTWGRVQAGRLAHGWQTFAEVGPRVETDAAGAAEDLRSLISSAPNRAVAAAARLRLADALRRIAESDPQQADAVLNESVEALAAVVDDDRVSPALVAAASYSLGTSYESLRDFDRAAEAYKLVSEDVRFAGSPFVDMAADRLASLDDLRVPVDFEPGLPPTAEPAEMPTTAATTSQPATKPAESAPTSAATP